MIDKNKENRKAKLRETLLQVVNISLPIIFTIQAGDLGESFGWTAGGGRAAGAGRCGAFRRSRRR